AEDVYRLKLAVALGHSKKDALQSDLFGDLAQLRHAIVHHAGIATTDVEQAKILKWFRHGEMMFITSAQVDALYNSIDSYITELCVFRKSLSHRSNQTMQPTSDRPQGKVHGSLKLPAC